VYLPAHGQTFSSALTDGFPDGERPTRVDWLVHLSSIITDVRLRKLIEIRPIDTPRYPHLGAVPALLTGLLYAPEVLEALIQRLSGVDAAEYWRTIAEISERGLQGSYKGTPMLELARELYAGAKHGLAARIAAGLEAPVTLGYLEPIAEVVTTGVTFAERTVKEWQQTLRLDPARFVEYHRVPSDVS